MMAAVLAATGCSRNDAGPSEGPSPSARYVGSESCRDCHAAIHADYRHTGHFRSMDVVRAGSLAHASRSSGTLAAPGTNLVFRIEESADGYTQVVLHDDGLPVARLPMHLVLGSGKYAQCFLRWDGSALFLLPLSYYAALDAWSLGPGVQGSAESMRGWWPITPRCLECHATQFDALDPRSLPEAGARAPLGRVAYARDTAVLGISCEKCHGPGSEHADYHRAHPRAEARFIANPSTLSPSRQVDVCALCHAPSEDILRPSFSFRPGDELQRFLRSVEINPDQITPHATQAPYLKHSRCFKESPYMTCTTCHDPHRYERGQLEVFSQRCLACHDQGHPCPVAAHEGPDAQRNCIDCHMPRLPATDLSIVADSGQPLRLDMRTHLIGIYRKAAVTNAATTGE